MEDINMNTDLKINKTKGLSIPVCSNGETSLLTGKVFYINENSAIYVQDVCNVQNQTLFEEGIKLIDSKVSPERKAYLVELFYAVLPEADKDINEIVKKSSYLTSVIALVCDIALHKNKKLAHPKAYHKDFSMYVANLFYHYFMDEGFEIYQYYMDEGFEHTVKLGSIPDIFVCPEKYFDFV
jgi:hypothetical protein